MKTLGMVAAAAPLTIGISSVHAQLSPLEVSAGEWVKSKRWSISMPHYDHAQHQNIDGRAYADGAFVCPGTAQVMRIYRAELEYLSMADVLKQYPSVGDRYTTQNGPLVPPPPAYYGCELIPAGESIYVIKLVNGTSEYVQVEAKVGQLVYTGITMGLMLTR